MSVLSDDSHEVESAKSSVAGLLAKAASWESSFAQTGNVECIDRAIECRKRIVSLTPEGHEERGGRLYELGNSFNYRFQRLGDPADVNKAMKYLIEAMPLMPDGHARKPGMRIDLGSYYLGRYERLGELSDLEEAIAIGTETLSLISDGHAHKTNAFNNLGTSYLRRFQRLGESADAGKAIEYHTKGVLLTPAGHPAKPDRLNNLGNSYINRFRRLGELADLDKAIEYQTQAVLLGPDGNLHKSNSLSSLGNSYVCRFERLGELADLDKAIDYQTQAVLPTPDDHADKPTQLNNLGGAYLYRFHSLGKLTDLGKATECLTQVVLLTPDGHADKPQYLSNLGSAYFTRFERLGELADVDKGIECLTQAVLLTPEGHAQKPNALSNLGTSYLCRFERLSELADVDKAIEYLTQAVMLVPDGNAYKPIQLNSLGGSYLRRFERFKKLEDLDKAIEYLTRAVELTPDGHAHKLTWLSNLGTSHLRRFTPLGELEDLEKAIEFQTEAALRTPNDHLLKPTWLNNLGNSHRTRFHHLGELADVDKAIELQTQAVLLTPDGQADKPHWLNNLGDSYNYRFQRLRRSSDHESARSCFQRAAQHTVTDPVTQIMSARKWAKSSVPLEITPLPAYERCMELIPRVIWLGMTIDQRYSMLTTISDLAGEAAAWAISVQAYDLAVEWLEQGRSIVWNQILQLRTPFDELSDFDLTLAECLKSIAAQLEGAGTRSRSTEISSSNNEQADSDLEKAAQRHRRLAEDWEEALTKARNIPGLENFMRPRKVDQLKRSATKGPVVLINTHSTRCDALIISPQHDDILHLPLCNLSLDKAGEFRTQLYSSVRNRGDTARGIRFKSSHKPDDSFKALLINIWSTIVKPILDACGYSREALVDELPEVTWCATGSLSFLPLHAAGPYDGLSPNAFDLVISSYTPTLATLLASNVAVSTPEAGLLAVGQESTPSLPPLPFTVQELELIKEHSTAIKYLQLDGEQAKVDAVLSGMDEHSWVHMACHASQDQANPAQSAFYLSDGSLSLETITKRQFKNKGLAFLSACQTATGDSKMPDEAVHLAAGMLMSGYPSVIATMWPIRDADGPEVAGRVYAELLKGEKMDHRGAARALHKAVAELRKKVGDDISERWGWVPFIHMGV